MTEDDAAALPAAVAARAVCDAVDDDPQLCRGGVAVLAAVSLAACATGTVRERADGGAALDLVLFLMMLHCNCLPAVPVIDDHLVWLSTGLSYWGQCH